MKIKNYTSSIFVACIFVLKGFAYTEVNTYKSSKQLIENQILSSILQQESLKLPPPPNTWNNLGSGLNNFVKAIYVDGTTIYAGGSFTDAGGDANADYIAKFNGTSWSALGATPLPVDSKVNAIAVSGSNVFIGGLFSNAFGNSNIDNIARWNGSAWSELGGGLSDEVYVITFDLNNLLIGGKFLNAGGIAEADYLTKWNTSTSTYGQVGVSPTSGVSQLNRFVRAIKKVGTTIYIGGDFTNASGIAHADYVAKMNGNTWSAICPTNLTTTSGRIVYAIDVVGSTFYCGGTFTNAGAVGANYIAKSDGTSWSTVGGNEINGIVYAIKADVNENIYVSGDFFNLNGNLDNAFISCLIGNTWQPLQNGLGYFAYDIQIANGGTDIYVGGGFEDAGGNLNADFIALWQSDILPLELLQFKASKKSNAIQVEWSTQDEVNTHKFEILHSADGVHFKSIGEIPAKGLSTYISEYALMHHAPNAGMNYYKLKTIDADGSISFSNMVNIYFQRLSISISPNPTKNIIYVSGYNFENVEYEVLNSEGKTVKRGRFDFSNKIDVTQLPANYYFVKINNSNAVESIPFIKN